MLLATELHLMGLLRVSLHHKRPTLRQFDIANLEPDHSVKLSYIRPALHLSRFSKLNSPYHL